MNQYFDDDGRLIVPKNEVHNEDNIVFKCNWNDKGWKGTCSKEAREFNVSKGHSWCIDSTNPCEDSINKNKEEYPCNESRLFIDFEINPGDYLQGNKRGENKYIRGASKGKLAFLTTVSPKDVEKDRYFIGIFDIEKIENDRDVYGNKETSVVINPKIKIRFWNYFKNKDDSHFWGSRQRYFNDIIALKILLDLKQEYDKLKGFEKEKNNLDMLITRYKKYSEN